ncbi:MAG: hypothetical protein HXS45_04595 [Theionarchaea archaeon]|nr:hypothetical protein [Theionarchaea archaeon]
MYILSKGGDQTNKKILVATGIVLGLVIATYAAAAPSITTPLYRYRMEQSSSKMKFLPTSISEFLYTTEKGWELDYCLLGDCTASGIGPNTQNILCPYTMTPTCSPDTNCLTCPVTCLESCPDTCRETCNGTATCETCFTCSTCDVTCSAGCLTAVTETC